jgi:hypothetical protein
MEKQQRELYSSHTTNRSHRMPVVLPGFLNSSPIDGVVFVGISTWKQRLFQVSQGESEALYGTTSQPFIFFPIPAKSFIFP